ncbi:hypothetical protein J6590_104493, partial [Homalodisca vitripennis]
MLLQQSTSGHWKTMTRTERQNGVIASGREKEWGQSQAVPTNPEHAADSDLSSER